VPFGRSVSRGGAYNRLVEPSWNEPLDTSHSEAKGGRWNAPGGFGVLYLNRSYQLARAQVDHKLAATPFDIDDLDPAELHDLVDVEVAVGDFLDCVSDAGLEAVGLPAGYPKDGSGATVGHAACQPIGASAYAEPLRGVACRSVARRAAAGDEELGVFDRDVGSTVRRIARRTFSDWYLGVPR
jgi:hypothetical protein